MTAARAMVAVAGLLALAACQREERRFQEPPAAATVQSIALSPLHPGGGTKPPKVESGYQENAYAISQGKQLYTWYNCVGCHGHGGGGMGPALMDDKWIYGSDPANIYATIVEGRPNGMPSFRGRIPNEQIWQLVAYVRSMSGLAPTSAAPGRDDAMNVVSPENTRNAQPPKASSEPAASTR